MAKYISSIRDLMIQANNNISDIKTKAKDGDPEACFQMGMIHLLGIKTPIDFKKASKFLRTPSLSDNTTATLLLGYIAELEGDYSSAFSCYANYENSQEGSYIDKVIKGRNQIQDIFCKIDIPLRMNKEISSILNSYTKSKVSRTGASVKIAAICEDEPSCLEAAKNLFDSKGYISAIQWLKKGKVKADNSLYAAINDMLEKSKTDLMKSKTIQIVDLDSNSLLSNEDPTLFLSKVRKLCDEASMKSSVKWKDEVRSYINTTIQNYKDKEHKAFLANLKEEETKRNKKIELIIFGAIILGVLFFIYTLTSNSVSKSSDPIQKENAVIALNNFNHDFNSSSIMFHHLAGTFSDRGGAYPIDIVFSTSENKVSDVVYKNIKVGVKIPLTCSVFNNNEICFKGKDGKNDFVISLKNLNKNSFEGTALVGNKEFLVDLKAVCDHSN